MNKKLLSTFLVVTTLFFSACSNQTFLTSEDTNDSIGTSEISSVESKTDNYLCVSSPTGGDSEVIKIVNLKTKELTSLPVPGSVQDMSAQVENNAIYVSSKSAEYYSLYKIDTKTKQVSRILLFSQLGLKPFDFVVDNTNVFVSGKRSGVGTFYVNDMIKNEWKAIANNISPGKITFGFDKDSYHVISFDDTYVTKSVINTATNQITARKSIEHKIPFGNNVFVPAPHGNYVYILHQLQDSFVPYVINVKQGTITSSAPVKTNGGLLYSAIVSNNGKHLLANVNKEIYHYSLNGDQFTALPKITLETPESRNMAMLGDNLTLYVTHDTGSNMTVVKFSADLKTYTTSPYYIGGTTNQVFVF